jgi:hypothetical protein
VLSVRDALARGSVAGSKSNGEEMNRLGHRQYCLCYERLRAELNMKLRFHFAGMTAIVAAALVAVACFGARGRVASDTGVGVAKSVRANADVALATDPVAAFWQGAEPVDVERDVQGAAVAGHRTTIYSRWTPANLYFLFVCAYAKLHLKPEPRADVETNRLWNWDVAEVFIGWDFEHIRKYKEFEMSPQGEWIDLNIDLDHPHHEDGWTWNSGFEVKARIDPAAKIWYGAMRIPFAAIRPDAKTGGAWAAAAAGEKFRVNFFRSQGPADDQRHMAWQPPMTESFHTPEKFGVLELVDAK